MKRKRNDKQVLIPRNNRQQSKRQRRNNPPLRSGGRKIKNQRRKQKRSGGLMILIVVIALLGFVIGAGIGVSLSLDLGDDTNETHQVVNVTKEMLNKSSNQEIYYDSEDAVDFNKNQSLELTNGVGFIKIK